MKEVVNSKHNTAVTTSYTAYHAITTSAIPTDTEKYVIVNPEESINIDVNEEGKYSVFDIANWFLTKGQMTHKKLQKLCYYAKAWYLALYDMNYSLFVIYYVRSFNNHHFLRF